jgi:hypothetical protein
VKKIIFLLIAVATWLPELAVADEVRHSTFPGTLVGTWVESADKCAAQDNSRVQIESTKYSDSNGSCAVGWIVETAGSRGTNYAAHLFCGNSSDPAKTQPRDIVVRPEDGGRASIGRSFEDLKIYWHCSAP